MIYIETDSFPGIPGPPPVARKIDMVPARWTGYAAQIAAWKASPGHNPADLWFADDFGFPNCGTVDGALQSNPNRDANLAAVRSFVAQASAAGLTQLAVCMFGDFGYSIDGGASLPEWQRDITDLYAALTSSGLKIISSPEWYFMPGWSFLAHRQRMLHDLYAAKLVGADVIPFLCPWSIGADGVTPGGYVGDVTWQLVRDFALKFSVGVVLWGQGKYDPGQVGWMAT